MPFMSSSADLVLSIATGLVIVGILCLASGAALLVWKMPGQRAAATDVAAATADPAASAALRKALQDASERAKQANDVAKQANDVANAAKTQAATAEARAQEATREAARAIQEVTRAGQTAAKGQDRTGALEKETLQLQATVEQERSRRLALEAVVAPRSIAPQQQTDLVAAWKQLAGRQVVVRSYAMDAESYLLGEQLIQCLKQAGLRAVHARSSFLPFGGVIVGIEVTSPTDRAFAYELARTLGAATFLKVAYVPPAPDARLSADGLDPMKPDAEILVGIKPPPGAP